MKVRTSSDAVTRLRRSVLELYVSEHPMGTCADSSRCEARDAGSRAWHRGIAIRRCGYAATPAHAEVARHQQSLFPLRQRRLHRLLALRTRLRGYAGNLRAHYRRPWHRFACLGIPASAVPRVRVRELRRLCRGRPIGALMEKSAITAGLPQQAVTTTCAYCGVGCSLVAEITDGAVSRMVPNRKGRANQGHACVKGRFAYGYATHADRVTKPMVRKRITDEWRDVSWDEAFAYAASEFKRIQAKYGKDSVGGITSSRCTNEETFLVQKLVRAAFGTNNVDTCARVCHSPTGYGLKHTLGESAGTQEFVSVQHADVIVVIGASPTEAHPVFASQMKRRLRAGARLIVIDPRAIALVKSPHVEADYHLRLQPGTNVAVINALAHVVVTEGLTKDQYIADRCEQDSYEKWKKFVADPVNSPEATEKVSGVPAGLIRGAARLYARGPNSAIYYGLGVTEHSQGTTMVMGIANLAMATGNLGREGVGVSPLRGQNNVQGSCDMGSFPHEFSGYRHVSDDATRALFESMWKVQLGSEPGLRIPNMFEAALDGSFRGLYIQGEDFAQSDPNTAHVTAALSAMECIVIQDIFHNETSRFAHVFLPGSSFLEKDGTFTNAERRISRVRKIIEPLAGLADWEATLGLSNALGYPMHYTHPSQIMDEIAALTPTFRGVSYEKLDRLGSIQWPCNDRAPSGTPTMHVDSFVRGKGKFYVTAYVPTNERTSSRYPLLLTTGRVLTQYNVGAQTRRTANLAWHSEDRLELHPHDAEARGIEHGDWVGVTEPRGRHGVARRDHRSRGAGRGVHHVPLSRSGAHRITTENSRYWATNCPEYKVTAVQVVKGGAACCVAVASPGAAVRAGAH